MISLPASRAPLVMGSTFRWVLLWKIVPTSGPTLRFTSHDRALTFSNQTYTPVGGFDASARQRQSNLREQNFEARGGFESNAITFDDLRVGKYGEAEVSEVIVDYRYPWAGGIYSATYWIVETSWDFERWEARVEGLTRWLKTLKGELYERSCRYTFTDARCTINPALVTLTGKAVFLTNLPGLDARRVFWTNLTTADDAFTNGKLFWLTGNNAGLTHEIEKYSQFGGQVELFLQAPYDIAPGDTFDVMWGCDKRKGTCKTIFTNFGNFGGFPFLPGSLEAFKTP
jgi:uncharacterized phage protein (TIGR02218 family)